MASQWPMASRHLISLVRAVAVLLGQSLRLKLLNDSSPRCWPQAALDTWVWWNRSTFPVVKIQG
jgi:hypothetical protein